MSYRYDNDTCVTMILLHIGQYHKTFVTNVGEKQTTAVLPAVDDVPLQGAAPCEV